LKITGLAGNKNIYSGQIITDERQSGKSSRPQDEKISILSRYWRGKFGWGGKPIQSEKRHPLSATLRYTG
jgi:hypothetical protein